LVILLILYYYKKIDSNIYNLLNTSYIMENQRGLTIVLWVIVIFGIFFLARGLTGKAILDITASDQCTSNQNCSSGNICCNGMCYGSQICSQITNTTLEKPEQEKNYLFDTGLGFLILIAVLIAFYGINRKSNTRVNKISKRKNRKKR